MTAVESEVLGSDERRELVEAVHAGPAMIVLATAGGGNAVITDLLDVPGASRTVLEVRVPYAAAALEDLVGPGLVEIGAVSQEMAEAMAVACLDRARALAPDEEVLLGVAVTAALVSDRPKRGDHRAHLAIASPTGVRHRRVELVKGRHDRRGEDRAVADVVLVELARMAGGGLS